LLYVAAILARRLDGANQAFIELKSQIQVGEPRSVIDKSIEKVNGLLGASGANFGNYGEVLIQSIPAR
ncbi:MAG: hypothetical protein WBW99_07260, partial [Pseudolabrys sp.]